MRRGSSINDLDEITHMGIKEGADSSTARKSSDKEILEIVIDEGLGLADGWEGMFLNLVSYLVAFTYCRFDSLPRTKVKVILLRIRQ